MQGHRDASDRKSLTHWHCPWNLLTPVSHGPFHCPEANYQLFNKCCRLSLTACRQRNMKTEYGERNVDELPILEWNRIIRKNFTFNGRKTHETEIYALFFKIKSGNKLLQFVNLFYMDGHKCEPESIRVSTRFPSNDTVYSEISKIELSPRIDI